MRRSLALLLLLPLAPALAAADAPAAPPKSVVPPPPVITQDNAAEPEPEVRLIQKGDDKIEEYRLNGQLYMIKVTPSHGVPYYLIDDNGSGTMKQVDPNTRVVIPRWVLVRF